MVILVVEDDDFRWKCAVSLACKQLLGCYIAGIGTGCIARASFCPMRRVSGRVSDCIEIVSSKLHTNDL